MLTFVQMLSATTIGTPQIGKHGEIKCSEYTAILIKANNIVTMASSICTCVQSRFGHVSDLLAANLNTVKLHRAARHARRRAVLASGGPAC